jgi:hypothetical protein
LIVEEVQEKDKIISWHKEDYPFACILMLSDTPEMQRGETVLKWAQEEWL